MERNIRKISIVLILGLILNAFTVFKPVKTFAGEKDEENLRKIGFKYIEGKGQEDTLRIKSIKSEIYNEDKQYESLGEAGLPISGYRIYEDVENTGEEAEEIGKDEIQPIIEVERDLMETIGLSKLLYLKEGLNNIYKYEISTGNETSGGETYSYSYVEISRLDNEARKEEFRISKDGANEIQINDSEWKAYKIEKGEEGALKLIVAGEEIEEIEESLLLAIEEDDMGSKFIENLLEFDDDTREKIIETKNKIELKVKKIKDLDESIKTEELTRELNKLEKELTKLDSWLEYTNKNLDLYYDLLEEEGGVYRLPWLRVVGSNNSPSNYSLEHIAGLYLNGQEDIEELSEDEKFNKYWMFEIGDKFEDTENSYGGKKLNFRFLNDGGMAKGIKLEINKEKLSELENNGLKLAYVRLEYKTDKNEEGFIKLTREEIENKFEEDEEDINYGISINEIDLEDNSSDINIKLVFEDALNLPYEITYKYKDKDNIKAKVKGLKGTKFNFIPNESLSLSPGYKIVEEDKTGKEIDLTTGWDSIEFNYEPNFVIENPIVNLDEYIPGHYRDPEDNFEYKEYIDKIASEKEERNLQSKLGEVGENSPYRKLNINYHKLENNKCNKVNCSIHKPVDKGEIKKLFDHETYITKGHVEIDLGPYIENYNKQLEEEIVAPIYYSVNGVIKPIKGNKITIDNIQDDNLIVNLFMEEEVINHSHPEEDKDEDDKPDKPNRPGGSGSDGSSWNDDKDKEELEKPAGSVRPEDLDIPEGIVVTPEELEGLTYEEALELIREKELQLLINKYQSGDRSKRDDLLNTVIEEPIEQTLNTEEHLAYLKGDEKGLVRPDDNITREEIAVIFYRVLDPDAKFDVETTENNFADVDEARWSNKAISSMTNIEVFSGYPDGSFKPGNLVTRGEVAAIAAKFTSTMVLETHFTDTVNHWAEDYINTIEKEGWAGGYSDGSFRPNEPMTRAELSKLLNGILNRSVRRENILPGIKKYADLIDTKWYYEDMVEATNGHYYNIERLEDGSEQWVELTDDQYED